ncbi:MAG TPA: hypothetical protein IGS17_18235 [Oscillatoriales cyanobacterium M59_W2019_021]|nr:MAG: hypothetical protein D6728_01545 [Cyanobacteria bacterium J055]HIK31833.1 hypothetical protein [Oscillatoriales cyanobacterium M4454_W2019_049]HIK52841.1 hypothetical protein [Oscillatoriales cyanobacterium M59_W2019_021]
MAESQGIAIAQSSIEIESRVRSSIGLVRTIFGVYTDDMKDCQPTPYIYGLERQNERVRDQVR